MPKALIVIVSLASVAFAQEAEVPRELKVLTSQHEKAVEKALKPITAKYLTALKRLKAKLAKEQKLEEALAVDAVIKELVGGKPIGLDRNPSLEEILMSRSWFYHTGKNGSRIVFKEGGDAKMSGTTNSVIPWEVKDNRYLTIYYQNGNSCKFDFKDLSDLSVKGITREKKTRTLSPVKNSE